MVLKKKRSIDLIIAVPLYFFVFVHVYMCARVCKTKKKLGLGHISVEGVCLFLACTEMSK